MAPAPTQPAQRGHPRRGRAPQRVPGDPDPTLLFGGRRLALLVHVVIGGPVDRSGGVLIWHHLPVRSDGPNQRHSSLLANLPGTGRPPACYLKRSLDTGRWSRIWRADHRGRAPGTRCALGPSWGRETAVNSGQLRCSADNQTHSSSAGVGRDGAAGAYMACRRSGGSDQAPRPCRVAHRVAQASSWELLQLLACGDASA
jgi:hypothetical protein